MKKKTEKSAEELQEEIKILKKQLEEKKLRTLIYQKVIEIAERDYNLDIVKSTKPGDPGSQANKQGIKRSVCRLLCISRMG
jgi:hypothetical protein